jgi:hypothetical protein
MASASVKVVFKLPDRFTNMKERHLGSDRGAYALRAEMEAFIRATAISCA